MRLILLATILLCSAAPLAEAGCCASLFARAEAAPPSSATGAGAGAMDLARVAAVSIDAAAADATDPGCPCCPGPSDCEDCLSCAASAPAHPMPSGDAVPAAPDRVRLRADREQPASITSGSLLRPPRLLS